MNDSSMGFGGEMAPRVGVMAGQMKSKSTSRKRPGYKRSRDQVGRVPTSVQSDANRIPRGGAVDLNVETDAQ